MHVRVLSAGVAAVLAIAGFTLPASAQSFAFGYSAYNGNETLTLGFSGGGSATIGTDGFQGWFSPTQGNTAGPDGNTNYFTGNNAGNLLNDFFVFDTDGQGGTVVSATLSVPAGLITGPLTWKLHDVGTPIADLYDGSSPNPAIYADLGSGVLYGSAALTPGESYGTISVGLDAAALAAINAALGGDFAVGGTVNAAPEPMTLALLGAGLLGLGMARRRRGWRRGF